MSQYLPYSEFKWLNKKEISWFCLNSISENSFVGYILDVEQAEEGTTASKQRIE